MLAVGWQQLPDYGCKRKPRTRKTISKRQAQGKRSADGAGWVTAAVLVGGGVIQHEMLDRHAETVKLKKKKKKWCVCARS